jgi:hypothetical protein
MKAMLLLTGDGALVILTSFAGANDPDLLRKLDAKGIDKFIAYEIPLDLVKQRYGRHFTVVSGDLHESDDLRILDYSGGRAFRLFRFDELGPGTAYEQGHVLARGADQLRTGEDAR